MFSRYEPHFNSKSYRLVEAPEGEPVSLDEAKAFLKVDGSDEDLLITALIATARRMCEEYTKRSFITQTWELTQDSFSDLEEGEEAGSVSSMFAPSVREGDRYISLSRGPIQAIESFSYYDCDDAEQTVASSTYTLDESGSRILLNDGKCWPVAVRREAGVKIAFTAGYGDNAEDVPQDVRTAILMATTVLYESRGCAELPEGVKAMLSPYQTAECFGAW